MWPRKLENQPTYFGSPTTNSPTHSRSRLTIKDISYVTKVTLVDSGEGRREGVFVWDLGVCICMDHTRASIPPIPYHTIPLGVPFRGAVRHRPLQGRNKELCEASGTISLAGRS
ncbi:hypothetical protein M758_7G182000 [Ceratodon purpureus]|nr:hypothetical protein M758_7G182000 [Ceratodon purpureus]